MSGIDFLSNLPWALDSCVFFTIRTADMTTSQTTVSNCKYCNNILCKIRTIIIETTQLLFSLSFKIIHGIHTYVHTSSGVYDQWTGIVDWTSGLKF